MLKKDARKGPSESDGHEGVVVCILYVCVGKFECDISKSIPELSSHMHHANHDAWHVSTLQILAAKGQCIKDISQ